MTLAGELKDRTVMDEAIDDGGGGHLIWEDGRPVRECQVRGDGDALPLVSTRNDLKEQVGCFAFEENVSKLINEQEIVDSASLFGSAKSPDDIRGPLVTPPRSLAQPLES